MDGLCSVKPGLIAIFLHSYKYYQEKEIIAVQALSDLTCAFYKFRQFFCRIDRADLKARKFIIWLYTIFNNRDASENLAYRG